MIQQFHEGQEVEVSTSFDCGVAIYGWRKAEIVSIQRPITWTGDTLYTVQFLDGSRGVFSVDHIREIDLDVPEIIMVP
jgi:hypothetical protein